MCGKISKGASRMNTPEVCCMEKLVDSRVAHIALDEQGTRKASWVPSQRSPMQSLEYRDPGVLSLPHFEVPNVFPLQEGLGLVCLLSPKRGKGLTPHPSSSGGVQFLVL